MKVSSNLLGGLAGAIVLNLIHESARRIWSEAPRINEIGEEGIVKASKAAGVRPPAGNTLYATTLAADLAGNTVYYTMIGKGDIKNIWVRGAAYGFTAGLGALGLTKPLGLDEQPIAKTPLTKLLTVAWYTIGGLVTAGTIRLLKRTAQIRSCG